MRNLRGGKKGRNIRQGGGSTWWWKGGVGRWGTLVRRGCPCAPDRPWFEGLPQARGLHRRRHYERTCWEGWCWRMVKCMFLCDFIRDIGVIGVIVGRCCDGGWCQGMSLLRYVDVIPRLKRRELTTHGIFQKEQWLPFSEKLQKIYQKFHFEVTADQHYIHENMRNNKTKNTPSIFRLL